MRPTSHHHAEGADDDADEVETGRDLIGPHTERGEASDEDDEGDEETEERDGDLDEDGVREDVLVEFGGVGAEVLHGVDERRQVVADDELVGAVAGVPEDELRGVD